MGDVECCTQFKATNISGKVYLPKKLSQRELEFSVDRLDKVNGSSSPIQETDGRSRLKGPWDLAGFRAGKANNELTVIAQ